MYWNILSPSLAGAGKISQIYWKTSKWNPYELKRASLWMVYFIIIIHLIRKYPAAVPPQPEYYDTGFKP
jgi:hypothetical protein